MSITRGTRLGDWVVEHPLGAGGMGSVYRCHSVLAKDVTAAVKVLKASNLGDDEKRFVQEMRTLAGLKHPNIVGVHGGGRCDELDVLYMAMELVDGEDLSKRLERGKMSVEEALKVFGPVTNALAYAHQNNVAHRDIKPANIMVRPDGTPVIVDFGIAVSAGQTRMTQEGSVPGTITYMPPEVFAGGELEPRSADAYALGVVMWEALTGEQPFAPDSKSSPNQHFAQIMGMKLRSDSLDPGNAIPETLRHLIRDTTSPEPEDRSSDLEKVSALMESAGAPVGPTLPGWSGAQVITPVKKGRTSIFALGFTGLTSAGCALVLGVVVCGILGQVLWANGLIGGVEERPAVSLVETLQDANLALERKQYAKALHLAGLAIDDHPADPNANVTYGIALASAGRGKLAVPYLCAAKDQGLAEQFGELDCTRGSGAEAPLSPSLVLAQVDASALLAAIDAADTEEVAAAEPEFEEEGSADESAAAPPSPAPPPPPPPPPPAASAPAESAPVRKRAPVASPRLSRSEPESEPFSDLPDSSASGIGGGGRGAPRSRTPTKKSSSSASGTVRLRTVLVSDSLVKSAVESTLRRYLSRLKYCYERGLRAQPTMTGTAKIRLNVSSSGEVDRLVISPDSGLTESVESCVTSHLRRMSLPDSEADYTVTFKITFTP